MTVQHSQSPRRETQRYAAAGVLFGLLFPVIATILRITNSDLPFEFASIVRVQSTDSLLWIIDTAPLFLGIFAALAGNRQDGLRETNEQLLHREVELGRAQKELEQRVSERTHELVFANKQMSARAEQLQLVADVAQSSTAIQDVDRLLPHISELISKRFDIHHVGIFLLDEQKQNATLRAANSAGGAAMLERGHHLEVGEQGLVGFVTLQGEPRMAFDVDQDPDFFNDPELPDTRSELVLPLKVGETILGALDLQSTRERAFNQEDVSVLTILADQTAVAIQNALLSEQARRALNEAEIATRQLLGEAWRGYANAIQKRGYRYDGIKPEELKRSGKSVEANSVLQVPVQLRGQTIGRLKLKPSDADRTWTADERAIIETTAARVAIAMEGARLLDEAQKRAARETFLSEIGAKLSTSFQLDSILRDTVEELGRTLKGSTVSFQLVNPSNPPALRVESPEDDNRNPESNEPNE